MEWEVLAEREIRRRIKDGIQEELVNLMAI